MQVWPGLLWVSITRPRGFQESQLKVILDSCQSVYFVFLEAAAQDRGCGGERQCESRKSVKGSENRSNNKGEKGGSEKVRRGEAERHRETMGRPQRQWGEGGLGGGCGQWAVALHVAPATGLRTLYPVTSFSPDTPSQYKTSSRGFHDRNSLTHVGGQSP